MPLIQISLVSSSRPHGVPSSTRSPRTNDRSRRSSDTLHINLHLSPGNTKFHEQKKTKHQKSIQFLFQITNDDLIHRSLSYNAPILT